MKFLTGYFTCFFMIVWAHLVFRNLNGRNWIIKTLLYMVAVCAAGVICFLSNFIAE